MNWFWWFLLGMTLLIPAVLLLFWLLWYRLGRIPRYGGSVGYRTARSRSSPAAWVYAHRYFGRVSGPLGLGLLAATVVVMVLCFGGDTDTVGFRATVLSLVQCGVLLVPMIATEAALGSLFGSG